ncbi:interferon regulatory factor 4a isoform X1 [Corythoichthys intestinalis]|uniref:interferon regulatory factor 4a isoform X1 n=1 Tax=Corythoichthys intestinalis TaxID=161448 RepID=UPI0025A63075|nr:interferon regulatory factor 4a isoform X1 [Corythoichthys intestinalis]
MNLEEDNGSGVGCCNGKLRQWLIDQINSEKYPGLVWENHEKTIFRIPWKHAGKQDYNKEEDAALFKAWATFKGKYKEGVDKPDHTTWKTRLRCALNKSNDFDELTHRTQLDISEPYKVYRIIPEAAKKGTVRGTKMSFSIEDASHSFGLIAPHSTLHSQAQTQESKDWRDYKPPEQHSFSPAYHCGSKGDLPYAQCHFPSPFNLAWPESLSENSFQFSFLPYLSEAQQPFYTSMVDYSNNTTDFSLHVSLFYRESLVKEVTTSSPEGCRISPPSSSFSPLSSTPSPSEFHNSADVVLFPLPLPGSQWLGAERLLQILERGVLLWMMPDGLYARRLCQGRVFWHGPLAPNAEKPNKLEKEVPYKLFDTQKFLIELQDFANNGLRVPKHQVVLCFGDEYSNQQRSRKVITAQVEPVFARKLVNFYQKSNDHYLQTYQHV